MNREQIDMLKDRWPEGARVTLISTTDPYTTLKAGSLGTVSMVDDAGTVHIDWADGSRLGMIWGEDKWVRD